VEQGHARLVDQRNQRLRERQTEKDLGSAMGIVQVLPVDGVHPATVGVLEYLAADEATHRSQIRHHRLAGRQEGGVIHAGLQFEQNNLKNGALSHAIPPWYSDQFVPQS
jgi:hypothetical protein